jgi:hypothetical protein
VRHDLGDDVTILAATSWRNNAAMVEDLVVLGYLKKEDYVLDTTYGDGKWWTTWEPTTLVKNANVFDFTAIPFKDNAFDVVVFDPPYVCTGGRETTTIIDFYKRYGLTDAPTTPSKLQDLIEDGLAECVRVVKPVGLVLVKCMDYVSSGHLWPGVYHTTGCARLLGLELRDHLYHVGHARPQPPGRRQVHARQNLSHLLVLEK